MALGSLIVAIVSGFLAGYAISKAINAGDPPDREAWAAGAGVLVVLTVIALCAAAFFTWYWSRASTTNETDETATQLGTDQLLVLGGLLLVALAAGIGAALAIAESVRTCTPSPCTEYSPWWTALAGFAIVVTIAALGGVIVYARRRQVLSGMENSGIGATVLGTAAPALGIAALVTIALYIYQAEHGADVGDPANFWDRWGNYVAVIAGILIAVIGSYVFAALLRDHTAPERTNPRQHGELSLRAGNLKAYLEQVCNCTDPTKVISGNVITTNQVLRDQVPVECARACVQHECIASELSLPTIRQIRPEDCGTVWSRSGKSVGSKWVLGTGFLDLWRRLHDADESLYILAPKEQVIASGLTDESRLIGSTIDNHEDLLDRLRLAVYMLGGHNYFSAAVARTLAGIPTTQPPQPGTCNEHAEAQATFVLRDIRRRINDFRDASREGLVRARNQLMWTGLITGVVAYVLLALAILVRTDLDELVAAVTFFLVGAVVGLFDQLRLSATNETGGEDFGLARARLVYTPVLSGLAGIGGVVLTAMLYATVSGSMLKYTDPTPGPAAPAATPEAFVTEPPLPDSQSEVIFLSWELQDQLPTADIAVTAASDAAAAAAAATKAAAVATQAAAAATEAVVVAPTETAAAKQTAVAAVTATETAKETAVQKGSEVEFDPPPLSEIFDLESNRFGLVIAAVFGLTPGLLVNRLQGQADKYKVDLQSTNVMTRTN